MLDQLTCNTLGQTGAPDNLLVWKKINPTTVEDALTDPIYRAYKFINGDSFSQLTKEEIQTILASTNAIISNSVTAPSIQAIRNHSTSASHPTKHASTPVRNTLPPPSASYKRRENTPPTPPPNKRTNTFSASTVTPSVPNNFSWSGTGYAMPPIPSGSTLFPYNHNTSYPYPAGPNNTNLPFYFPQPVFQPTMVPSYATNPTSVAPGLLQIPQNDISLEQQLFSTGSGNERTDEASIQQFIKELSTTSSQNTMPALPGREYFQSQGNRKTMPTFSTSSTSSTSTNSINNYSANTEPPAFTEAPEKMTRVLAEVEQMTGTFAEQAKKEAEQEQLKLTQLYNFKRLQQ